MNFADVAAGVAGLGSAMSNIANVGINIANYKQAKNALNYQKQLQQQIFAREDSAVQRRVADLSAAGLSPVLAAGSAAGTGGTVAINTPQMSSVPDMSQVAKTYMDMITQKQQISNAQAQERLIDQQIEKSKVDMLQSQAEIDKKKSETLGVQFDNLTKSHDWEILKRSPFQSKPSGPAGMLRDAEGFAHNINEALYRQGRSQAEWVKARLNASKIKENQTYFFNPKTKNWEKRR